MFSIYLMHSEMSYKEIGKNQWEIVAKYRVLRSVFVQKIDKIWTAKYFSMHRNTVSLICCYYKKVKSEKTDKILYSNNSSYHEITESFSFLQNQSRKPLSLHWIAPPTLESMVLKEFAILWYWYRRMLKHLQIKWSISFDIKEWMMKWIYSRNKLVIRKVRTKNWESKPLYNYSSISAFEYLHYDVKHIEDQGALPEEIYKKFQSNAEIPKYQRTIIDAKTRWRFLAYSNSINSTMWLEFLKFTIMFIRNQWIWGKITVWFDWWVEFCSASDKKLAERNSILQVLDCIAYQYHWPKDVRKNLIERSHKSDDEEFYVPRWSYINDRKTFENEAKNRFLHRNFTRIHTWIAMHTTPYKKLLTCGIRKTIRRDTFPLLFLDEHLSTIMYHTKTLDLKRYLMQNPIPIDPKLYVDFQVKLNILHNQYAQNVLTPYLFDNFLSNFLSSFHFPIIDCFFVRKSYK